MEIIDVINNLGFPIGVAVFALWNSYNHEKYLQGVLDNTLKENTAALRQLTDVISEMKGDENNEN